MSASFAAFTNQYQVLKTLRFELKPIGKTAEWIKEKGLIQEDEQRSEDYKKMKKVIDEYHKYFIEIALSELQIPLPMLQSFRDAYEAVKKNKGNTDCKKKFAQQQAQLREEIHKHIIKTANWNLLFSKEFIKEVLPNWINNEDNPTWLTNLKDITGLTEVKKLVRSFDKWVTYFKGFNDNRKNVYSKKDIPTSIIYRIVHDNLPKFLDNISRYEKLKQYFSCGFSFGSLANELNKELSGHTLNEVFSLEYFTKCLNQSGIDRYNTILGGKFVEGESQKRKGVNEYINQFVHQQNDNTNKRKIRSLKMVELYKQILSDRESSSFVLEKFEDDKSAIETINFFYKEQVLAKMGVDKGNLLEEVTQSIENLSDANLDNVFVRNDRAITDISNFIFGNCFIITDALKKYATEKFPAKNESKPTKKVLDTREKWVKKTNYFSISELDKAITSYLESLPEDHEIFTLREKINAVKPYSIICKYFKNFSNSYENKIVQVFNLINSTYDEAKNILESNYPVGKKQLPQESKEKDVEKLKAFLDSLQNLLHFLKPLRIDQKNKENKETDAFEKDSAFYGDFDACYEQLSNIIPLYNQVRNYITQKPFSTEKFKLNFENVCLANGWDRNKETQNTTILLRKNGLYYLGVMDKSHNDIFENIYPDNIKRQIEKNQHSLREQEKKLSGKKPGTKIYEKIGVQISDLRKSLHELEIVLELLKSEESFYEKMIYKQIADAGQDIQNLMVIDGKTVSKKGRKETKGEFAGQNLRLEGLKNKFLPDDINTIRKNKTYSKSSEFSIRMI